MENIFKSFKKIGEIAVAITAISFVFYIAGFFETAAYFRSLGISTIFLNLTYQDYVFSGVLNLFVFILFIPFFLDWYLEFDFIKKTEGEILKFRKKIESIKCKKQLDDRDKKEVEEIEIWIENISQKTKRIKSRFTSGAFNLNISLGLLVGIIVFILIFSYFNKDWIFLIFAIIETIIGMIISITIINHIQKSILNNCHFSFVKISFLIIICIFLFPILAGYAKSIARIKANYFYKVRVITQSEVVIDADLITFGNNVYIFRNKGKNLFIPASEIKQMESID